MTAMATTSLAIPVITDDMATLEAGLAYAAAGLYIGPCERGSKHPGSVIGDRKSRKGWQRHTSRDIQVITAWLAGTDHSLFIHAGRSGLWIADVDNPANIHPKLQQSIAECEPPYQSTRPDQPGRGHYLFQQPPGRDLGNSLGRLANGWARRVGVTVSSSSHHPNTEKAAAISGSVRALYPSCRTTWLNCCLTHWTRKRLPQTPR